MKSATSPKQVFVVEYFGILCGIYSVSGILFDGIISALFGIGAICFLSFFIAPKFKMSQSLFWTIIMISNIPMSFRSIIGVDYSRFPLTWFSLAIIVLFCTSIRRGIRISLPLLSLVLFTAFFLISELFSNGFGFFDAFKQYFNIVLLLMTLVSADSLKCYFNTEDLQIIDLCYLCGVFSFAVVIIVQYIQYYYLNIVSGYIGIWANRQSYAGTFSDFSFASVYLATGCLYVFISVAEKRNSFIKFVVMESVLLVALLLVNARTGVMAFVVTIGLYIIKELIRLKRSAVLLLFLSIPFIIFVVEKMVNNRGGQSFLDGSGRGETYIEGLNSFFIRPLLGIGFGVSNYSEYTQTTIPHNMIVQFLAQFGLIGSSILAAGFIPLIKLFFVHGNTAIKWMLVLGFVASMLIPDIASSHYFSALAFISVIGEKNIEVVNKSGLIKKSGFGRIAS